MNNSKYPLRAGEKLSTYEFVSEGPKGKIDKIIQFTLTNYFDLYNLAFGDKHKITGQINDKSVSNNSDSEMILATIVSAVYTFTDIHPEAWIYATGSTQSRTRLYRMGITKYLEEAKRDFEIFGQVDKNWEPFKKNTEYKAFLVKRKN